jgi:hypothetical protein
MQIVNCNNIVLKKVENFCYLGGNISSNGKSKIEPESVEPTSSADNLKYHL